VAILKQILRRKLALFGLVVILVVVAAALFAPWIVPFSPDEQLFDGLTLEGARAPASASASSAPTTMSRRSTWPAGAMATRWSRNTCRAAS